MYEHMSAAERIREKYPDIEFLLQIRINKILRLSVKKIISAEAGRYCTPLGFKRIPEDFILLPMPVVLRLTERGFQE